LDGPGGQSLNTSTIEEKLITKKMKLMTIETFLAQQGGDL